MKPYTKTILLIDKRIGKRHHDAKLTRFDFRVSGDSGKARRQNINKVRKLKKEIGIHLKGKDASVV